jgi:hypothetical protein
VLRLVQVLVLFFFMRQVLVPTPRATTQYALLLLLLLLRLDVVELSASCWFDFVLPRPVVLVPLFAPYFARIRILFAVAVNMRCGRGSLEEPSGYL